jgi:signal transduction histidine kinase/CheY-like chemotaxis protein/PAS domain-containing protein
MGKTHIQLEDIIKNKSFLDQIPLAFFIKDKEGRYIGANHKYLSAINLETEEELLGYTDYDLVTEEDADYFYEADSLVLTGATYEVRTPIHEIENNHYHVSTTKIPVYKDDKIVGLVGMFHDIGPQELQILDEYKTGESLVREKILNGLNSAVFIIDSESHFLIRANTIGHKLLTKCNEKDKEKLLFDNSWGINTSNDTKDLKTISIKNSKYIDSIKGYFTLTYGEIDWEDRKADIRYVNDVTQLIEGEKDAQLTLAQLNIALAHSKLIYFDYNINTDMTTTTKYAQSSMLIAEKFSNFPYNPEVKRIIHPDYFELYKTSFETVKSGLKDYVHFESLTLFKNTEYRWRDIKMSAIYDNEGHRDRIIITGIDIERYKQLETRVKTILSNNDLGAWEFDLENDLIIRENSFGDEINKSYEIPLKETFKDIHKDDLENFKNMFEMIKKGDTKSSSDYRAINYDGKYEWFHSELSVFKNENGKAILAIGSSRNVTMLKLAEKRYNDEMTFLRLRNESQLIYCLINLTKVEIVTFSSTDKKLQMAFVDDLVEKLYTKLSPNDTKEDAKAFFVKDLKDKFKKGVTSTTKTVRVVLTDKLIYLKLTMKVIQNPETLDLMCFLSGENVDMEVKTQQMLQISSDQNYELFTRMDFENDEMIARANNNSTFNFNANEGPLSIREGLNRVIKTLNVSQERMDNLEEHFNELLADTNSAYTIFKVKNDDGVELIKRSKLIYIDKEHRVFGEFWDDITELQRENEYRNKQLADALVVAQSANDAKTVFLSSMSHDIRTPLNAIIGMNNIALEDINNKEQVKESLEIIKDSSAHLLSLINDILDLSRIESNKRVFNIQPHNAFDILNELIRRMNVLLLKKNQKIITDFNIKNPNIMIDKPLASRMIENVLTNSSKFSGDNTNIYFSIHDKVTTNDKYNNWLITIRDEGVGMTKEELDNVFNPFFRSNNSIINNIEGTGLGLAIVKKNLAEISGTIRMESEYGVGTTTYIETPIRIQAEADKITNALGQDCRIPGNLEMLKNKRILVVEDNKVNMLLATKVLEKFGIIVTKEYDGKEALKRFKSSPAGYFDCILSDVKMPIMDGFEMTRNIRALESEEAKNIPIIAMTANAFVSDVRDCLAAGMDAHLSKPIDVEALKILLLKFLNKQEL